MKLFAAAAFVLTTIVSADIQVVSYNQFWWHVKQVNDWGRLYSRVAQYRNADLFGFQECENVQAVLQGAGIGHYSSFQGPNKPYNNPAPLAWNPYKFQQVGGPASVHVADDKYGGRYLNWIRLREISSGQTIFFGNTHGPLGNCGNTVGYNWANAIRNNMQNGDHAIVTGDFNCADGTQAMNYVHQVIHGGVNQGIDHCMSNLPMVEGGARDGSPSDHVLVEATFRTNGVGPSPSPGPSPGPSPAPLPAGCPPSSSNPCCHSCSANRYCPTNRGCFSAGARGCGTALCPPRSVEDIAWNVTDNTTVLV